MENRFRHLFLAGLLGGLMLMNPPAQAQEAAPADESVEQAPVIEPQPERRQFHESQIDADDFEILVNAGFLSIEDFGVNALLSLKLSYYVNEAIFVQLVAAQSEGSETSFEVLSGGAPLLTPEERELSYYSINIGFNLLPGEVFVGDSIAYNSALYLSAGIGNTEFAGDDRFTYNYGIGYRFLLSDAIALYSDFRNNVFDMDVFGRNKTTNNLEFTIGVSWFF